MNNSALNNYYKTLNAEVKEAIHDTSRTGVPEREFTKIVLNHLEELGETFNTHECYYGKPDAAKKLQQINGFALNEAKDQLDLFVTKYYENSSTIPNWDKDAIAQTAKHCFTVLKNAANGSLDSLSSTSDYGQMVQLIKKYAKDCTDIRIYLLTNGILTGKVPPPTKLGDTPVQYRFFDVELLYKLLVASTDHPIEMNFKKDLGQGLNCLSIPTTYETCKTYLTFLSGDTLANLYEEYRGRLLEQNIRTFLEFAPKSVNHGIRTTIKTESHMFLAYNNGIAATAKAVILNDKGNIIEKIMDLQIVNGGQTTVALYYAKKKDKLDVSNVFVQMKLSIIAPSADRTKIISNIAKYANRQNKVNTSDLSSQNEFLIALERISRLCSIPTRTKNGQITYWFFERLTGQRKTSLNSELTDHRRKRFELQYPVNQTFSKQDLARYYNSWEQKPHYVVKGGEKNHLEFIDSIEEGSLPTNIFFEDLISKAILFKQAEIIYGEKGKGKINPIGDMRFVTVPYALSWLNLATNQWNQSIDLVKIWKNQTISIQLADFLKHLMIKIDKFIQQTAPAGLTIFKGWAAKLDCWELVKVEMFADVSVLKNDLVELEVLYNRVAKTEEYLTNLENQLHEELLTSITPIAWQNISKWGHNNKQLSDYQDNIIYGIILRIERKTAFTDAERTTGLEIYKIILEKARHILSESEDSELQQLEKKQPVDITLNVIEQILLWEKSPLYLETYEISWMEILMLEGKPLPLSYKNVINAKVIKLKPHGFVLK